MIFRDGYSLALVLWGIVWTLGGAGLVVALVKGVDAEDRAVRRAETTAAERSVEREAVPAA